MAWVNSLDAYSDERCNGPSGVMLVAGEGFTEKFDRKRSYMDDSEFNVTDEFLMRLKKAVFNS